MKIACRVTENGLIPLYDNDLEEKKRLKIGSDVICDIKLPRNLRFHNKFFLLIDICFDNLPEHIQLLYHIRDKEDMLKAIKTDFGLFEIKNVAGVNYIEYGSISFDKMDNTFFERFYQCSVSLIIHKYLIGTKKKELIEEIERNFI